MNLKTLADVVGFDWDKANKSKIEKRMSLEEVEEAFTGQPYIAFDAKHSQEEQRWFLINHVRKRYMVVVFTVRKNKIRPISARFMHKREIKKYGKKIKK